MTWHASDEKTDLNDPRSSLVIAVRICPAVRELPVGHCFTIFIFHFSQAKLRRVTHLNQNWVRIKAANRKQI